MGGVLGAAFALICLVAGFLHLRRRSRRQRRQDDDPGELKAYDPSAWHLRAYDLLGVTNEKPRLVSNDSDPKSSQKLSENKSQHPPKMWMLGVLGKSGPQVVPPTSHGRLSFDGAAHKSSLPGGRATRDNPQRAWRPLPPAPSSQWVPQTPSSRGWQTILAAGSRLGSIVPPSYRS